MWCYRTNRRAPGVSRGVSDLRCIAPEYPIEFLNAMCRHASSVYPEQTRQLTLSARLTDY